MLGRYIKKESAVQIRRNSHCRDRANALQSECLPLRLYDTSGALGKMGSVAVYKIRFSQTLFARFSVRFY